MVTVPSSAVVGLTGTWRRCRSAAPLLASGRSTPRPIEARPWQTTDGKGRPGTPTAPHADCPPMTRTGRPAASRSDSVTHCPRRPSVAGRRAAGRCELAVDGERRGGGRPAWRGGGARCLAHGVTRGAGGGVDGRRRQEPSAPADGGGTLRSPLDASHRRRVRVGGHCSVWDGSGCGRGPLPTCGSHPVPAGWLA